MKALTLTQPWATLVALGVKHWETRGWACYYRGPIAIHAAKHFPKRATAAMIEESQEFAVSLLGIDWQADCGKVLAIAQVIDCQKTEKIRGSLSPQELEFGDYGDGRYAFRLAGVTLLPTPIAAVGHLMLWDWQWPPYEPLKPPMP